MSQVYLIIHTTCANNEQYVLNVRIYGVFQEGKALKCLYAFDSTVTSAVLTSLAGSITSTPVSSATSRGVQSDQPQVHRHSQQSTDLESA